VNGVTPKPKRCQLQTLVKLREFIGRLLFGPPSLEHDGRAQITVTQTAERHAPGTSDPDTSLTDIDLRLSPGALSTRTVASSATRRARRISATTLTAVSGEDDKHRVNRRTSFESYREVALGMIRGALSVRRTRDDFRCRDYTHRSGRPEQPGI
jgi:hypothetical protein